MTDHEIIDPNDPKYIQDDLEHFIGKTFEGFTPDQIKKSELSEDSKNYVEGSDELITLSIGLNFTPRKYESFNVFGMIQIFKNKDLISSIKTEEDWDNDAYQNIIGKQVTSCVVTEDIDIIFEFTDDYSMKLHNCYGVIEFTTVFWDKTGLVMTLT